MRTLIRFGLSSSVVLLAATHVCAISMRHDLGGGNDETPYLTEGAKWDSVGFMQWTEPVGLGGFSFVGTGTIVEKALVTTSCAAGTSFDHVIITAAHNVDGNFDGIIDVDASGLTIYFGDDTGAGGGTAVGSATIPASQMAVHPSWFAVDGGDGAGGLGPGASQNDFAILTFSTAQSTGTLPSAMKVSGDSPTVGSLGTTVGYGDSGFGDDFSSPTSPDGKRRAGENNLDVIGTAGDNPANTGLTIQSDFDAPSPDTSGHTIGSNNTATALEATTASGDSGGPIIVSVGGNDLIFGVLNGGFSGIFGNPSEYGDRSIWAHVGANTANQTFVGNCIHLTAIPEPSSMCFLGVVCVGICLVQGSRRFFWQKASSSS